MPYTANTGKRKKASARVNNKIQPRHVPIGEILTLNEALIYSINLYAVVPFMCNVLSDNVLVKNLDDKV